MTQGLFTAGTSIEELLAKRNTRANALQQSLMANAAQGAARPMQAQAASLIGSSLGRALAGSMNGGQDAERAKIEAANAAQSQAQAGYLDAAAGKSAAMFAQVEALRTSHPAAAVKMLALAKQAKKEEDAVAAAQAKAVADAEEATRVQELAAQKIIDDKAEIERKEGVAAAIRVEERAQELSDKGIAKAEAAAQALKEEEANKVVVISGADYNAEHGSNLSEDSMWKLKRNGDMTQIDKPSRANVTQNVPEGMGAEYDKKGNITKLVPIEGGKQWLAARAAEAELLGDEEREYKAQSVALEQGITINAAIDRALEIAELDSVLSPIFGKSNMGKAAGAFEGSERSNLEVQMEPILADAAFDTLADMRAASKTGGALGAINKAELDLLKAARGALSLRQDKESWVRNMKAYQIRFKNGLHGSRADIERHNSKNPDSVPLVYWGDAEAAAKAEGKATQAEAGFGTGTGPNAAAMPASVAKYY